EFLRNALRTLPGMNTGHPDLFRAFIWRFIQLVVRRQANFGVVLPGDAFKIKGGAKLRTALAGALQTLDVQLLTNKGEWVFDDVDGRKLISLCIGSVKFNGECTYYLRPEIHDPSVWAARDHSRAAHRERRWLENYCPTLVMPTLPAVESVDVLDIYLRSP